MSWRRTRGRRFVGDEARLPVATRLFREACATLPRVRRSRCGLLSLFVLLDCLSELPRLRSNEADFRCLDSYFRVL